MEKSAAMPYLLGAVVISVFAALAYASSTAGTDGGIHYSPATVQAEELVCPSKCFDYSVGLGEGRVDVNCEVAKRYVHQRSAYCSGIESYTVDREKVCACPAVRVSERACPRSCSSGELVCNVDAQAVDRAGIPCEGHREQSLVSCRCEDSGGDWKALI